jgi:hypothetical protein
MLAWGKPACVSSWRRRDFSADWFSAHQETTMSEGLVKGFILHTLDIQPLPKASFAVAPARLVL